MKILHPSHISAAFASLLPLALVAVAFQTSAKPRPSAFSMSNSNSVENTLIASDSKTKEFQSEPNNANVSRDAWAAGEGPVVVDMDFGWRFARGGNDGAVDPEFDDSGWEVVNVPHDFLISQPWVAPDSSEKADLSNQMANIASRLSSRGFKEMGTGWYRKSFDADPAWKDKRVVLDFEGIMLVGDVWVNGQPAGSTDYGYLGFETDITDLLRYEAPNVITVRANTGEPDNSRWYTGGGLFRDVKLKVGDKEQYFTRHGLQITTPVISPEEALVVVNGEFASFAKADSVAVGIEIVAPDGSTVYSHTTNHWQHPRQRIREYALDSILIAAPRLWDVDSPNLYTLRATLLRPDGSVADRATERFGIRSLDFSPEHGLMLNGRKVLLKGIANHHTLGALGAAAYPRAIEKRLRMLKNFGFNHVRSSHNPYSESFLDLCDELGILVVDELYDKWTTQYAGGRKDWNEQWLHDVPEWVKRDRNHPSIVFWSLGNELQLIPDLDYNDWGVTPYHLQKTLLNRYDRTRPVTVAMHPRGRNEHTDSLPAPLVMETDIAAYNYRYMYFPGDSRRFPWMMFYQSEANASGMGPNFFEMDLDKVIGLAYWGMIDYMGESKGWPAKGWTEGVFDISLEPKPAAYFLKSYFDPGTPLTHIGIVDRDDNTVWNDVQVGTKKMSSHWNRIPGSKLNLYTFTNADEVELIVNGHSLGRQPNDTANPKMRNRILWEDVAYKPGYIEAIGYTAGKPTSRHRVETASGARKLRLTPDNAEWTADGQDLQYITIEAIDGKGRVNPQASQLVTFEVEGPAEIVGVINGDMTSDELFTGNSRSLWQGKASVILRAGRTPGNVTIKATAPGLSPATLRLSSF